MRASHDRSSGPRARSFTRRRTPLLVLVAAIAAIGSSALFATTGAAVIAVAPSNTSPPTISGTAQQGQTLTATFGTWSGDLPISYSLRWQQCDKTGSHCKYSSGSTTQTTHVVQGSDVDHTLRVEVTATNASGSATAESAATAVVSKPGGPANTALPTISGTAQESATVFAGVGSWSGTAPISYSLRWLRCDVNGNGCAYSSGSTTQTAHVVEAGDVGHTLRVEVTATNSGGSTKAQSHQTAVVSAKPAPTTAPTTGGSASVRVETLSLPHRLVIDQVRFTPPVVRSVTTITLRVHVTDASDTRTNVAGAVVRGLALPYSRVTQPAEVVTGDDGWATLEFHPAQLFPRSGYVFFLVRARKPGENVLAGITTSRLVQITVHR